MLLMLQPHAAQNASNTRSRPHMDLARFWINECLRKHRRCHREGQAFTPSRLIHVGSQDCRVPIHLCLNTDSSKGLIYCTLSHCWGGAKDILKLLSNNFERLREGISYTTLPKTFQDTITITRWLGQIYLRIDSLCIIQDSEDDWTKESAKNGKGLRKFTLHNCCCWD
jgi:hypothetical protein